MQILGRINTIKKGYQPKKLSSILIKTTVLCFVIMLLAYTLAKHEGIPVILLILTVVILIYSYFTRKTVPGRYIYAMGGNEKAAKLGN